MDRLRILVPGLAAILVAVLATPLRIFSIAGFDGYSSLVALFLQGIKQELLPPGWKFIVVSPNEYLQVYIAGSLILLLMLGSPLIAFIHDL
jgi:hypothetical protein